MSNNTMRLIFIGLILDADDEGRGLAHTRLLARKLDQQPEEIEQALEELAARAMIRCYEVASRRLYWLCHWHTYQTLSKPTPSHYPAPPEAEENHQREQGSAPVAQASQTSRAEEIAGQITAFSAPMEPERSPMPERVAAALHLPESEELREIVQEFETTSNHSALGEAIEARAWIDDRRRNARQQPMTLAFFRRWLRRSQHHEEASMSVPTRGKYDMPATQASSTHEPDQYEVYVNALMAKYSAPEALQEAR